MRMREFIVELGPRAVGFVGNLEHFAAWPHAVDAHYGNADDQVLVLVDCIPSGRPPIWAKTSRCSKRGPESG